MKRIIALTIAALLILSCLCGCGTDLQAVDDALQGSWTGTIYNDDGIASARITVTFDNGDFTIDRNVGGLTLESAYGTYTVKQGHLETQQYEQDSPANMKYAFSGGSLRLWSFGGDKSLELFKN